MARPDSVGVRRVPRDPLLSKGREVKKPRHEEMLFPMHSSTIFSSALLLLSIATGCAGPGAAQDIATPAPELTGITVNPQQRAGWSRRRLGQHGGVPSPRPAPRAPSPTPFTVPACCAQGRPLRHRGLDE